jgi:hypothetical protein
LISPDDCFTADRSQLLNVSKLRKEFLVNYRCCLFSVCIKIILIWKSFDTKYIGPWRFIACNPQLMTLWLLSTLQMFVNWQRNHCFIEKWLLIVTNQNHCLILLISSLTYVDNSQYLKNLRLLFGCIVQTCGKYLM